ncbi:MAG: M23 family metallopeptidase [Deltaproteobacteria bacterium]|jgi:murein DD-endopeptidase MepM/ murein hydrolase activator NlpD|nr:M23 family metallopeptidase [Deltaproteobacteria bacterium]
MLLRKYHIVVFRENKGTSRQLNLRGWVFFSALFLVLGLAGCSMYLWGYQYKTTFLSNKLKEATKTIQEQNIQIANIGGKLMMLQNDLARVQQFDSKLRVMMNLDRELEEINGGGGGPVTSTGGPMPTGLQPLPLYRQELLSRRVHSLLDQMDTDTRVEELRQQDLLHAMRENRELLASTPSTWPVEGYLTSTFGNRVSPFGSGTSDFHKGLDIANRMGTPVRSPAKGTVTFIGWDGGYGNCVIINHGNNITTRYAHLSASTVTLGQTLMRGDKIGLVGNSGRSTGPHLHYEVRVGGVCVNPLRYILN